MSELICTQSTEGLCPGAEVAYRFHTEVICTCGGYLVTPAELKQLEAMEAERLAEV